MKCLVIGLLCVLLAAPLYGAQPQGGDNVGTLRFSDAQGKPVALDEAGMLYVVDFWALGCQPCMNEMSDLDRLQRDYEGKIRIVGVIWGDWKGKDLPKIAKQVKTSRPVYSDYQHWFDSFQIRSFPTKLFIKDGVVVRVLHGAGPDSYGELKPLIEAELNPTPAKWE